MLPAFSTLALPSRYLHLPDVRIHYRVVGEGPTVALLHGLGSSGSDWFPVTSYLAPHYRLLLIDLRGHGHSSLPRTGYSVAAMARDVQAVLAAEGIESAALIGLSLGGCVALQTAVTAPDLVAGLVLVNTFAKLRHSGMFGGRLVRLRRALGDADGLARLVAASLFTDPEVQALVFERLRRNDVGAIRRTMLAVARFDVRSQLGKVTAPTLVLAGDRDRTVPRLCLSDLMAGLPAARLQVIADAGHALPYDQPDDFVAAVCSFLAQLWPQDAFAPTDSR